MVKRKEKKANPNLKKKKKKKRLQIWWERREGENGEKERKEREQWERTWFVKHFTWFIKGGLINWVLETQFPDRRHAEKMPHQTWSDYGNRVFETRFIGLNRVFETRDVSNIYSLKTVPTNYIVWQIVLISNFGRMYCIVLITNLDGMTKLTKIKS